MLRLLGLSHGGRGTDDNAGDRLHATVWVHNLSCSTNVGSLQAGGRLFEKLITEPEIMRLERMQARAEGICKAVLRT